jgi:pimeloyl-ACP methyl ester carboxylesterase
MSLIQADRRPAGRPVRPFPQVPGVTHRFVSVRGIRLHIAEAGAADGEAVLLLHGFPEHWYAWRHVIPLLAADFHLICPDLRGFGWSEAPASGYDTASRVEDVLTLLDVLGLRTVRLIGHHEGGQVAFRLALQAPQRVSHLLTLNSPHPWISRRRLIAQAWRYWYTAFLEYPGIGRLVLRHWPAFTRFLLRQGVADPGTWRRGEAEEFVAASREQGTARAGEQLHWQFVRHDIPAIIRRRYRHARLEMPTVILAGAQDPTLPAGLFGGAETHGTDVRVRVIQDAGHFLADEHPGIVADTARELFARMSGCEA